MKNLQKLQRLVRQMDRAGVLEDRREYCPDDLQRAYLLTDDEAMLLFALIQAQFQA